MVDQRILNELERGDDMIERMKSRVAMLEAGERNNPRACGLLDPDEFHRVFTNESRDCSKIGDALTFVQLQCYPALSPEAECRFVRSLTDLLNPPGDAVGRLDVPGSYGLIFPWTDTTQANTLKRLAASRLTNVAPEDTQVFASSMTTGQVWDHVPSLASDPVPNKLQKAVRQSHR
jgi:hypothetical protein